MQHTAESAVAKPSCQLQADAPLEASIAPHYGRLFVDLLGPSARYQLTDTVTCERVRLPEGVWSLMWDDESKPEFAALVNLADANPVVHDVEDFLTKDIYNQGSERFVVVGGDLNSRRSFDNGLSKYRGANLQIRLGPSSAQVGFNVFVMAYSRHGCARVFWALNDLYKALNMATFSATPSKWVHHAMKATGKRFAKQFSFDRFLLSRHANMSKNNMELVPWWSRCLPTPSASTLQLLVMLLGYGHAAPERGGLRNADAVKAARDFEAALIVKGLSRAADMRFELEMNESWQCLWPRPSSSSTCGHWQVAVAFVPPCGVDFGQIFEDSGDDPGRDVLVWRKAFLLAGFDASAAVVPITTVLDKVVGQPRFESIVAQILWALATHVESALGEQKDDEHGHGIDFEWKSEIAHDDLDMEMKLVAYQQNALALSSKFDALGIASDKGNPAGQNLLNTVFIYENNFSVLATPTVLLGQTSWGFRKPALSRLISGSLAFFWQARRRCGALERWGFCAGPPVGAESPPPSGA